LQGTARSVSAIEMLPRVQPWTDVSVADLLSALAYGCKLRDGEVQKKNKIDRYVGKRSTS
jgi:hypothetical protein